MWIDLRGSTNTAARNDVYTAMQDLADRDAALMTPAVGDQWRLVTKTVFARGKGDLAG
jgi:hypothetical protein